MEFCFVLVRPMRPENVGAAARALQTMGMKTLRIVSSQAHLAAQANWLAHGAQELLAQTQSYDDLATALVDIDLAIGTTARPRHGHLASLSVTELAPMLAGRTHSVRRVAVVFGCEESGLSNIELQRCHIISHIPLAQPQPSLNLAQAVMLYAWELSAIKEDSLHDSGNGPESDEGSPQWAALLDRVETRLTWLGIVREETPFKWVRERLARASDRDVGLLHFMLSKLDERMRN
jgi:tRNA/rRNA methyltransferase